MIHIITAFNREENKDFYIEGLKSFDIIWHPITTKEIDFGNNKWIKPLVIDEFESKEYVYCKLNKFIKLSNIIEDDYYLFMNDDDWFEDGFFDKIRNLKDEIIFISMKRGDIIPPNGIHPTHTLVANPSNVIIGGIGLEQYIVKGNVLKQMIFDETINYADGLMAIWLCKNFPIVYKPDIYAYFNYLEKGRWKSVGNL